MQELCGYPKKEDGSPCQNSVGAGTHCAAGHPYQWKHVVVESLPELADFDPSRQGTVDLEVLQALAPVKMPKERTLQVPPPGKSLAEVYPHLIQFWDPINDLTPNEVFPRSTKQTTWICPEGHGSYITTVNRRTKADDKSNNGCITCRNEKFSKAGRDAGRTPPQSFKPLGPELLEAWSEGNTISPHEVGLSSSEFVLWNCPNAHPPFLQSVRNHVYSLRRGGNGCRECANEARDSRLRESNIDKGNRLIDRYPELEQYWHPDNALEFRKVTARSGEKALWLCPKCGSTNLQRIANRTVAHEDGRTGCQACASTSSARSFWRGSLRKTKGSSEHGGVFLPLVPPPAEDGPWDDSVGIRAPSRLYLISNPDMGLLKVGKSRNIISRLEKHRRSGFEVVLDVTDEMDGRYASAWELSILATLTKRNVRFADEFPDIPAFDGYTESWQTSSLKVSTIKQLMDMVYEDELDEASNS